MVWQIYENIGYDSFHDYRVVVKWVFLADELPSNFCICGVILGGILTKILVLKVKMVIVKPNQFKTD